MTDRKRPTSLAYRRCRFAAALPLAYLYSKSHFWLAGQADGTWRVGMTKFATRLAGETVELGFTVPVEAHVNCGQILGFVEGFKAVSDLRCVARGTFLGGNPALQSDIALVNKDPHGAGWLYAVAGRPAPSCMTAQAYARHLDAEIDRLRK
jgi:glycine cleavage system H protein